MYDRLLDVMNTEETREREKSPPKSIKTESDNRRANFSEGPSPSRIDDRELEAAVKELEAFGYSLTCDNSSIGSQDGYGVITVAEVEITDEDD